MSPPKPLAHVQQQAVGYCLPACAQMALAQLGIAPRKHSLAVRWGRGRVSAQRFPTLLAYRNGTSR